MSEGKTPSFWTTLPGILTGLASLLTAIVALFSVLAHQEKATELVQTPQVVESAQTVQPAGPSAVAPSLATPAAAAELKNLDDCGEFVGKWNWFIGGELRAEKDGTVDWRQKPEDALPVIVGRWVCLDTRPQQINISWPNGISETLLFSPDKKSLSGKNTIGVQVSGSKKLQ